MADSILAIIVVILTIAFFSQLVRRPPKTRTTTRKSVYRPNPGYMSNIQKRARNEAKSNTWADMSEPTNQMEAISKVRFERTRLLNKSEARLLPHLEQVVREHGKGHRVMAQTVLGEIIKPVSTTKSAWAKANASINSKRLDFLIIDKWGMPVVAIEYQGGGHYRHDSFMRDAVKKEALRKAGVAYIEVEKGMTPSELKPRVFAELERKLQPQAVSAKPQNGEDREQPKPVNLPWGGDRDV